MFCWGDIKSSCGSCGHKSSCILTSALWIWAHSAKKNNNPKTRDHSWFALSRSRRNGFSQRLRSSFKVCFTENVRSHFTHCKILVFSNTSFLSFVSFCWNPHGEQQGLTIFPSDIRFNRVKIHRWWIFSFHLAGAFLCGWENPAQHSVGVQAWRTCTYLHAGMWVFCGLRVVFTYYLWL